MTSNYHYHNFKDYHAWKGEEGDSMFQSAIFPVLALAVMKRRVLAFWAVFLAVTLSAIVAFTTFTALAQIGSGNRGIVPINNSSDFSVWQIEVDVRAESPGAAREKGWRLAQRIGWQKLYRKITGRTALALSDSSLDSIVSAIVVESEHIAPRRYIATLGVLFDRARAGQILGVSVHARRSPPFLVMPVFVISSLPQIFEQRNAWQRAWAEYAAGDSVIDYVRAAGTGADTLLLNTGQVGRRSRVWWRVILDHYQAADVVIPSARLEFAYPGGPVTGYFSARFGPDNKLIERFTLRADSTDTLPAMMRKAVERIDAIYAAAWRANILRVDSALYLTLPIEEDGYEDEGVEGNSDALQSDTIAEIIDNSDEDIYESVALEYTIFSVQYFSPDAASMSATEQRIAAISGVDSAVTNSLALGGMSVMRVAYRGDSASLRAALLASGYAVQGNGATLRIDR